MIAKELRIGNLVDSNGIYYEVISINSSGDIRGREADTTFNLDSTVRPILLDKKWFLRFGFYEDGEFYSMGIEDYKFCFIYQEWNKGYAFKIEYTDSPFIEDENKKYPIAFSIKYVHQLQNLYYSLLNKELLYEKQYINI